MRFAHPAALLLLPLIPALLLLLRRRTAPRAIGFPTSGELARLRPSFAARLHAALPWLRALVLGLAVLALAGPQWGVETTRLLREGIAIAMVIDTSSSMSAIDLRLEDRPSDRLEVVKAAFREFVTGGASGVDGRSSDAIGMVTFARYADNISPPTLDHEALLALLDQVRIVELPTEDGTAIGDAIVRAIEVGDTAAAVHALVPVAAPGGRTEYVSSEVSIDEVTLTQIAQLTDGKYFRATDAAALRAIYGEIDRLEKAENVAEHQQRYVAVHAPIIALGLALLLLEVVLVTTRLRAIP